MKTGCRSPSLRWSCTTAARRRSSFRIVSVASAIPLISSPVASGLSADSLSFNAELAAAVVTNGPDDAATVINSPAIASAAKALA